MIAAVGALFMRYPAVEASGPVHGEVVIPTPPPQDSVMTSGEPGPAAAPHVDCQPAGCVAWTSRPLDLVPDANLNVITGNDNRLLALASASVAMVDTTTGSVGWRRAFAGPIGAADGRDGTLLVEAAGAAHLIAADDGRDRWVVPSAGDVYGDLIGDGIVFTTDQSSTATRSLVARSVDDGSQRWRWTPARGTHLIVHRSDNAGVLVSSDLDDELTMLDAATGRVRWRRPNAHSLWHTRSDVAVLVDPGERPAGIGVDGSTYAIVTAVALDDGTTTWRRKIPLTDPSFGFRANSLVVASSDRLTALDLDTGAIRWEVPTTEPEQLAFHTHGADGPWGTGDGPVVTVGRQSGTVRARDSRTGKPRWRQDLPSSAGAFARDDGEHVTVLTEGDTWIFAAATGASTLSVASATPLEPVGPGPLTLVDPSTGSLIRLRLSGQQPP